MNAHRPSDPHRLTLKYYDENADAFDQRTRDIDMSPLYQAFLPLLPPGGYILDAGCGTGRDSAEFLKRGFRVLAVDASKAMVERAAKRIGQPVLNLSFEQMDFDHEFHGVWANASLLHVPKVEVASVVQNFHDALVPGGVVYASFKLGEGEEIREGRFFNNCTEQELHDLLTGWHHESGEPGWSIIRIWRTGDIGQNRPGIEWVHLLARSSARARVWTSPLMSQTNR